MTCPSAEGAPISCTVDPRGFSVLTAPGLSIAWERDPPGPCPAPSCLLAYPDGGGECVIFAPGQQVCYFALPDGGTSCDLCPIFGDAGPPDIGPHDAGTDASLPPFTAVREPTLVAGLFVFRPRPIVPIGIHTLGLEVSVADGGAVVGPVHIGPQGPGGSCGPPIPCSSTCGLGERICFNGHYGSTCASIHMVESCNGHDDDCDGLVDEFTSYTCSDPYACTEDVCLAGSCHSFAGPDGAGGAEITPPVPDRVGSGLCARNDARCEQPRCAPDAPLGPSTPPLPLSVALGDRTDAADGSLDRNGCVYVERDTSYCEDVFGGGCSGPLTDACTPGTLGTDPTTGCLDWCHPVVRATALADVSGGKECSGTYSPGATLGDLGGLVMGYNNDIGRGSAMAWAFRDAGTGHSWSVCDPAEASATPGCAGPVVSLPFAAAPTWAGDPVIAADGQGHVVLVSMVTPTGTGARYIVASISADAGRTFASTVTRQHG